MSPSLIGPAATDSILVIGAGAARSLRYDFGHRVEPPFDVQRLWKYFPRFSEDQLRAGAPARLWCNQGRGRVWRIGGVASMESVPNVVDYNPRLLSAVGLAARD